MSDYFQTHGTAFNPSPSMTGAFILSQLVAQVVWMGALCGALGRVETGTVRYCSWYAFGNICMSIWVFLWASAVFHREEGFDESTLRVEATSERL